MNRNVKNRLLLCYVCSMMDKPITKGMFPLIIFTIQSKMRAKGITEGLNYEFLRWHQGVSSLELEEDIESLIQKGFLQSSKNQYSITSYGEKSLLTAEVFFETIEKDDLHETVQKWNLQTTEEWIQDFIHPYGEKINKKRLGAAIMYVKYDDIPIFD